MSAVDQVEAVWAALEPLTDPEIPVVTLRELGILRDVRETADGPRGGHHADLQRLPGHGPDRGRRARHAGRPPASRPG
jgi:hypothetical protein